MPTTSPPADLPAAPQLIGGDWSAPAADRYTTVHNPSTGEPIARTPMGSPADVDAAARAARDAFDGWSATPAVERARVLFRLRDLIDRHADELAQLVTREHGKTLAESRAEVQRGLEAVEFGCSVPALLHGVMSPEVAREVDAETARRPLGVVAGITPYNFPFMVPMWMVPTALACGNCFVLKPSEKVPLTGVRIGELLIEAGLPPGVFNVVHGGREVVDAILEHPLIEAVSFVGSTTVAHHVYSTAAKHGKRAQAAGGAKNHLVVMPDADLDAAARAIGASAYGCSGQRCMAGSVAVAVGRSADELVGRLTDHAASLKVGPTDAGDAVDVGPLIDPAAVDRVSGYLDVATGEGATLALDGRKSNGHGGGNGGGFFVGPSVVDRVAPGSRLAIEEVFGPVLSVVRVATLEEALAVGKGSGYGNGASIFTRDGHAARAFKRHFPAGMIGVNVGVPAPMAWFPFAGWGRSFFGDLHLQGEEGVQFYTKQKVCLTRWFGEKVESIHDPVWKR